jgi:menaquinone-dependent protoporphyrinogen oxidase
MAMTGLPVFYATTEGHTRRIAEAIAGTLREQGFDSEAVELSPGMEPPAWVDNVSAVLGASLHAGQHQAAATAFAARELQHLNARPTAFFSVSLGAASRNPAEVDAVRGLAAKFADNLTWRPRRQACFAGCLAYTKYGIVKRWMMRRIAAREGGSTDTSRDHDLTDWKAVRDFALAVAADARDAPRARPAS